MSLLDDMRLARRVTSTMFDDEIRDDIAAAIAELRRCGVSESLLSEEDLHPLAKKAVRNYVMSGQYDNPDASRFNESFRQTVIDLMNSSLNECAVEE